MADEKVIPLPTARPPHRDATPAAPAEVALPATVPTPTPSPFAADAVTRRGERIRPNSDVRGLLSQPGVVVTPIDIPQPAAIAQPQVDTLGITRQVQRTTTDLSRELTQARGTIVGVGDDLLRARNAADRVTPTGTLVMEGVGALDRGIIRNTPTSAPQHTRSAIADLSTNLASLLPRHAGRDYNVPLHAPIFYDDGRGTRIAVPPGGRLISQNGQLRLESPGAFVTANGTTVLAQGLRIDIGPTSQSAVLDRFRVQSGATTVDLQGLQTRLGTDGSFLMRADSAVVDVGRSRISLTGAEFSSTSPDTMRAGWEALAVRTPGVTASTGQTALTTTTRGMFSQWTAQTENLNVDTSRTSFHADTMTLNLQRDAATGAGALAWTSTGVRYNDGRNTFTANAAAMDFVRRADGTSALALRGNDVTLNMGDRIFSATGQSTFQVNYDTAGQLVGVVANGDRVQFTDRSTNVTAVGATLQADFNREGLVTRIAGGATEFSLVQGNNALNIQRGAMEITRDGNAVRFHGEALSGRYTNNQGTYELGNNGTIDMRVDGTTTTLTGTAGAFSYADGRGRLDITNGRVDATFAGNGADGFRFTGDNVRYTGNTERSQLTNLTVDNAVAEVRRDASGAMSVGLSGRNFAMDLDGHKVTVANADHVNVRTNPQGQVTSFDMLLPGRSTFTSRDGDVNIGITGLDTRYTRNATGEALRIGFDQGNIDIKSLGLVANATGLRAGFQVDDQGRLTNAGLSLQSLDARYRGTTIRVNNQPGESLSLGTRFDNGVFRDAVLRVPNGGEILVGSSDVNARIGQGVYRLSYDDSDQSWRVRARDFRGDATIDGYSIRTDGRNVDATLVDGQLRINNITGTNVRITKGDMNVNVDVAQLDNLLFRASGITGLARGAMITLTPTADNSRITANITARYGGIPFSLRIDNARQLEALAMVQVNQARAMVRDPSGQGHLRFEAGPLSIEGRGEIGAVVTYQPYSAQLFTESVYNMVGEYRLGDHLRINPNGTLGMWTAPSNPIFAGATLMLPRTANPWEDPLSGVRQPLVPTDAPGFVATLGFQTTNNEGTRNAFGLYGGVVPGSTARVDIQGDARLFGVAPLPSTMTVPTTVISGLRYERENRDSTLTAIVGAQTNVAGLAQNEWLREPARIGVHAAASYQARGQRDFLGMRIEDPYVSIGGSVTQDGQTAGRIGFGFKF